MDEATLLKIQNKKSPTDSQIDDDEDLAERAQRLVVELRDKYRIVVEAECGSHPWYLRVAHNQGMDHSLLLQRCDECAATFQIDLG